MKKIILTTAIVFIGTTLSAQWTDNGTTLTTTDNVGIGETNPQIKLHVKTANTNSEMLRLDGGTRTTSLIDYSDGTYDNAGIQFKKNSTVGQFKFSNNNGDLMTIRANGNVGIGTTSPSEKLDVVGNAEINGYVNSIRSESTGQPVFYYSRNSINSQYALRYTEEATGSIPSDFWHFRLGGAAGANGVIWGTTDNPHLTLLTSGNVGIGTASPDTKLHIQGTAWTGIKIQDVTTSGGRGIRNQYLDGNGDGWQMYFGGHYTGQPLRFGPLSQGSYVETTFTLLDNGNVGIGTETPQSKLAVNGQIRATEVKVLADISVPDYVFEPDYELLTLKETKEYIEENKHLPEIPSAAEIGENGIDLGDMNMRLLKKIEELTLYQIELLEKLEQQNEQIEELKTSNVRIDKLEKKLLELTGAEK